MIASDFLSTYVMYYHDNMMAASQAYFTGVFGVGLQMGVYYQSTSGNVKLYDATDHASGDKGTFISTQGNKAFCEYLFLLFGFIY